jgi:hypothetical protein
LHAAGIKFDKTLCVEAAISEASFEVSMELGLAKEAELQRDLLLTEDATEGVVASAARRQPKYRGC